MDPEKEATFDQALGMWTSWSLETLESRLFGLACTEVRELAYRMAEEMEYS
jgi:hypothetical protein